MLRAANRPLLAYFDAIKHLRLRQVTLILKTGYDPNLLLNARGQNGLQFMINHFAATDAHFRLQAPINKAAYLSIGKLLLDSGLDPNTVDLLTGETVMFDAIRFNDKEMVTLLLNYVDFSLRNKNGETALMCAARFGSKQVMRLLLEHLRQLDVDGYFLRQRNRLGLTPLELARVENLDCAKAITKHLINYGQHPTAVLARSTSHHQLMQPRTAYHMRALGYDSHRAPNALLANAADSDDDYELDLDGQMAAAEHLIPSGIRHPKAAQSMAYKSLASYTNDPKVAEFNAYLLEQQQDFGDGAGAGVAASSDEDEAFFGAAGASVGLTRSRSCMLGPSAASFNRQQARFQSTSNRSQQSQKKQQQQQQQQQKQQQVADPTAKGMSSSWDSAGNARA